jgi:phosphoglycolate phosphatase
MSQPLALFDLDGTLVDSAPDISHALNSALISSSLPAVGEQIVRSYIGEGAQRLVHRAITRQYEGVANINLYDQVSKKFLNNYAKNIFIKSKIYPKVEETLQELKIREIDLGCVTNKPYEFAISLLKAAGLFNYFAVVVGGDSLSKKKPNPAPIIYAIKKLGAKKKYTSMIGDSLTDLNAAKNAGVQSICVSYGYSGGIDLSTHNPDRIINSMEELPKVIMSLSISPNKNRRH